MDDIVVLEDADGWDEKKLPSLDELSAAFIQSQWHKMSFVLNGVEEKGESYEETGRGEA